MSNPQPTISAIETIYNGWRFRSRLEARWALFFDELEIRYWYETEGYRLADGTCYLPDFYLPQVDMLAEVKPAELTPGELLKCRGVAAGLQRPILMLVGPPDFRLYTACMPFSMADRSAEADVADFLLDVDSHQRIYFLREHRLFGADSGFEREADFTTAYRAAVHASRAARFEVDNGKR